MFRLPENRFTTKHFFNRGDHHYTYQNSFQINDPGVAVGVAESPYTIDDDDSGDSNGNSNFIANGGETLEIYVTAKNYGSEDATNVMGHLMSSNANVVIDSIGNISEFGNIFLTFIRAP